MTTPLAQNTLAVLRGPCLNWIESIRDPDHPDAGRYRYSRHMVRPFATESTAHVLLILWLAGLLTHIGGPVVHVLLVIALALIIYRLAKGRKIP